MLFRRDLQLDFFNQIEGVWGAKGTSALWAGYPQTIYVMKIEMAQGYSPFCKK